MTRNRPADETGRGASLRFVILAAAAALFEVGLLLAVHLDPPQWGSVLAAHLALSAALVLAALGSAVTDDSQRFVRLLAATLPLLGPFAPLLLLLVYPLYLGFRASATPFETWYRALFPEAAAGAADRLYQSIQRREVPNQTYAPVVSYLDVMAHGSVEQKVAVIATVVRSFRPVFAPVLKAAIGDANPAIRVQAATAITKLTDDFVDRVRALEAAVAAAPDDLRLLRELAGAYDEYAFAGILDVAIEEGNRLQALQLWLRYCERAPDDVEAATAVGRLLMRLERHELAAQWFGRLWAEGRITRPGLLWYLEVLYALGHTDQLRRVAAESAGMLAEDAKLTRGAVAAAVLWAGGQGSRRGDPREAHP
jgi:hypothetical protein